MYFLYMCVTLSVLTVSQSFFLFHIPAVKKLLAELRKGNCGPLSRFCKTKQASEDQGSCTPVQRLS